MGGLPENKAERRAAALRVPNADVDPVAAGNLFDDGEAEAGARQARRAPPERLKDDGAVFGPHARAMVHDFDHAVVREAHDDHASRRLWGASRLAETSGCGN